MKVLVVGGGWAGLAAAVTLCQKGIPVTLLESAKQLGGRARSVDSNGWHIDNGQHLMLGAYSEILKLLRTLNIREQDVFKRSLLSLNMRSILGGSIKLQVPNVAAPMHLLWAVIRAKGFTFHERGTALRLCLRLGRHGFKINEDQALEKWLQQNGQSRNLIRYLWEPLCLAAMNTPIKLASTEVFIRVLHDSFAQEREHSDLLFILPSLNECLPNNAQRYIEAHGGTILNSCRVTELLVEGDKIKGVATGDTIHRTDRVILATPPWVTARLLSPYAETKQISAQLAQFNYHPICTVYLQYPEHVRMECDMLGIVDSIGQWVFDRRLNKQPGLMSIVISGPGKHMGMNDVDLANGIIAELATLYPKWPSPNEWRIIREKRATFECSAGINMLRPSSNTPLSGLSLAGDYVATGYPATLEGAVRSGLMCADGISKH